jgi:LETM1 and EF-hand domain-containing protein 1
LEVDEKASYKQKLDVLKEQEELIEDEAEQEHKEEEARRRKKAADERARQEEEACTAKSLLPDSELQVEPIVEEAPDARMTTEQLGELGEALSVLSARSSVLKERRELKTLMEENLAAEEDPSAPSDPLARKIRTMLGKLDNNSRHTMKKLEARSRSSN